VRIAHNGMFNVAFMDGHVKSLRETTFDMWNAPAGQYLQLDLTLIENCGRVHPRMHPLQTGGKLP
jgi:prepilin-type processing-associated H-X9-DG protein